MTDQLPTVQPADVAARLEDGWRLVDVRTDEEWADERIDGSLHIPLDQFVDRLAEVPERAVVVCASGRRSARATGFLLEQGRQAVNLDGGLHAWTDAGQPVAH